MSRSRYLYAATLSAILFACALAATVLAQPYPGRPVRRMRRSRQQR